MKRDDPQVLGGQAAQFLESPVFKSAWESQYTEAIAKLERIDTTNEAETVNAVRELQAAVAFKASLVRLVRSGDLAKARSERDDNEVTPMQAGHFRR